MSHWDIVLVTEDRYVNPQHINDYIANILQDDALLIEAFAQQGWRAGRVSWSDTTFDWSSPKCIVFRTMWDYFNRFTAFTEWLNRIAHQTVCINAIETVRWNMDKHYLADLHRAGIAIVETQFIEKGSHQTLQQVLGDTLKGILKPAVSGAARHTYIVTPDTIETIQPVYAQLIAEEALLFQPFQDAIVTFGEISCMLVGGQFTHAVLKRAKTGDFRVQDDFGGTVHPYTPTSAEIAFAEQAIAACFALPAYARVDFTRDAAGLPVLMELELIEPELWFRKYPPAATTLAQFITQNYL